MPDATFDKLIISDEEGAHLSVGPYGIKMHDETGELRTELWTEDDGPTLLMYDRNGQERVALFIDSNGTPHLRLDDANGQKRVSVSVGTEGSPVLQFFDATEVALFECTLKTGRPPRSLLTAMTRSCAFISSYTTMKRA